MSSRRLFDEQYFDTPEISSQIFSLEQVEMQPTLKSPTDWEGTARSNLPSWDIERNRLNILQVLYGRMWIRQMQ